MINFLVSSTIIYMKFNTDIRKPNHVANFKGMNERLAIPSHASEIIFDKVYFVSQCILNGLSNSTKLCLNQIDATIHLKNLFFTLIFFKTSNTFLLNALKFQVFSGTSMFVIFLIIL
ncbi:MAG: hypothetical protein ACOZBL_05350 [Patescibacteria group bacterium]